MGWLDPSPRNTTRMGGSRCRQVSLVLYIYGRCTRVTGTLSGLRGGRARIIPHLLWIGGQDGRVELPLVVESLWDILRQPFLKSNDLADCLGNEIEEDAPPLAAGSVISALVIAKFDCSFR